MSKNQIEVTDNNSQKPRSGIPSISDVEAAEKLESFRLMWEYSRSYLLNNESNLTGYKWIKDSFNQWSRIYEYPYCFEILKNEIADGARVLDAGSGVTFFPFFLNSKYKVTCIDQDDYSNIFDSINVSEKTDVSFIRSGLHTIPIPDNSFDAIYCISVLEHTDEYDTILKELYRLLKPQGLLIATFDISLDDNKWGIDKAVSISLIESIGKYFYLKYGSTNFKNDLQDGRMYTTRYVQKYKSRDLLPWPAPTFKSQIKNFLLGRALNFSINLTFCNLSAGKK